MSPVPATATRRAGAHFRLAPLGALAATPVLVAGHHVGFVAEVPLVLVLAELAGAVALSHVARFVLPPGGPPWRLYARVLLLACSTGTVIYTLGWGAVLAIGLVLVAAEEIRVEGSRAARPAALATTVVVLAGEAAVAAGIAPSLVPQPDGHGLAALVTVGTYLIIGVLGFGAREKEQFEHSLRHSEERLRALVQHASDAIVVMRVDGSVAYASPATERILGHRDGGFERFARDLVHPDRRDEAREFFASLANRPGGVAWIELPLVHADGTYRWFEIGMSNRVDDPAVGGMVLNMRDVTERRVAQEQLTFQAYHDALTMLPNRWLFLERLEHALVDAARDRRHVAVLFLDIDRFKFVNDSLGHDLGDRVLVAVAERLAGCVRADDVVARFGGDEFTILMPDLPGTEVATAAAERITQRLREPLMVGDQELFISASVGLALSYAGEDRARDLLRQSDLAMYIAKEKGRSRWELFNAMEAPHVVDRLELEGDLWRAFENGELRVHFQPEVDLRTGAVVATEALVRWEHPRKGTLEPDAFVPYAEESALIVAIDRYVLREACAWARRWSAARPNGRPLVVSVNLSPRFIRQTDVVGEVMEVLRDTGVDPRAVQIELTERSALTDLDAACTALHQLRALGVRVAVDDFGTGYSSLSYLKQLPIDVLKLDRSLLDTIDELPSDVAIVRAVVTMGHALGVKVTAEGVEREEQAVKLCELGCDSAMGWLWSRALPPAEVAARAAAGYAPVAPGASAGVVQLHRSS